VVVASVANKRRRAAAGSSAAGASYEQGSILWASRSGMQMEAALGWKTVSSREMNPSNISSAKTDACSSLHGKRKRKKERQLMYPIIE